MLYNFVFPADDKWIFYFHVQMIKKIITRFKCIVITRCRCVVAPAEKRALTTLTVRFYSSSDTFSIFEEEKEMLIGLIERVRIIERVWIFRATNSHVLSLSFKKYKIDIELNKNSKQNNLIKKKKEKENPSIIEDWYSSEINEMNYKICASLIFCAVERKPLSFGTK